MTGANLEIANSYKPLISCIALIQAYASFDSHAAKLFLGKICVFLLFLFCNINIKIFLKSIITNLLHG